MTLNDQCSSRWHQECARGYGYLRSIKRVRISGIWPSVALELKVVQGIGNQVHFEPHELLISGEQALNIISTHRREIENRSLEVFLGFEMINPRVASFIHEAGKNKGQLGTIVQGFLTQIMHLSVDGNIIYEYDELEENISPSKVVL